jgi:hypothetical protein
MSDDTEERGGEAGRDDEARRKKPYASPRIIEYGRAADLTGGGSGSRAEMMAGGGGMKHP